jgi:hypothetical protein
VVKKSKVAVVEEKNPAGRKTKLTPELQKQLVEILQVGSTVRDACALVGITESIFYLWMAIGEGESSGKPHKSQPRYKADRQRYLEFFEAIRKAQSHMRNEMIAIVVAAAKGNARKKQKPDTGAAMWLLERSDPNNWGKRTVDINNQHSGKIEVEVEFVDPEISPDDNDDEDTDHDN